MNSGLGCWESKEVDGTVVFVLDDSSLVLIAEGTAISDVGMGRVAGEGDRGRGECLDC